MTPANEPLVCTSRLQCDYLCDWLEADNPHTVALDTETEGCNPDKESPVWNARVWNVQLAWKEPGANRLNCVVVFEEAATARFKGVLEQLRVVGSGILDFDRHALFNPPWLVRLQVVGDTWNQSRLLNPLSTAGHGLKQHGRRLGYDPLSYSDVAGRCVGGQERAYKRDRETRGVQYVAGCAFTPLSVQTVNGVEGLRRTVTNLRDIWENYPQRRAEVIRYITEDALMSWDVYHDLDEQLALREHEGVQ